MCDKYTYLELYEVAPAPKRDYYCLKVFDNQVILYIWKISHGPHKAPIVHKAQFSDYNKNKILQDEISHAFGQGFLDYIEKIINGDNNTLLTLPRNLVQKISSYLQPKDIRNLCSSCYVAKKVFDNNFVWDTIDRRYMARKIMSDVKNSNPLSIEKFPKEQETKFLFHGDNTNSTTKTDFNLKQISSVPMTQNNIVSDSSFENEKIRLNSGLKKSVSLLRREKSMKDVSKTTNKQNKSITGNISEKNVINKKSSGLTKPMHLKCTKSQNLTTKCHESEIYTIKHRQSSASKSSQNKNLNNSDKKKDNTKPKIIKEVDYFLNDLSFEDELNAHLVDLVEAAKKNINESINECSYDHCLKGSSGDSENKKTKRLDDIPEASVKFALNEKIGNEKNEKWNASTQQKTNSHNKKLTASLLESAMEEEKVRLSGNYYDVSKELEEMNKYLKESRFEERTQSVNKRKSMKNEKSKSAITPQKSAVKKSQSKPEIVKSISSSGKLGKKQPAKICNKK